MAQAESQPVVLSSSKSEPSLMAELEDLRKQLSAKEKRIAFLEHILRQRTELTENKYAEKKKYFDNVCDLVYRVFLKHPDRHFTYNEFCEIFPDFYPNVPIAHIPRRIRDLRDAGHLWSDVDPETKEVRFWLKLEESTDDRQTSCFESELSRTEKER